MGRLSTVLLWVQTHPLVVTGMLVVSLLLAGVYAIVIFMAIGSMDADYFMRSEAHRDSWRNRYTSLWLVIRVIKNLLGVLLVLLGLAMLVLPGQGILTILIGISLLEFPGKHRLELAIVKRPSIRRAIDRIRERSGTEPLNLP